MSELFCSGGAEPSTFHLKKELTLIRKVARVLRDPGTCSSWKKTASSTHMGVSNSVGYSNGDIHTDIAQLTFPEISCFEDILRNHSRRSGSETTPMATFRINNGDCRSSVQTTPDEDYSDESDSRGECQRLPVCITSPGMSLFKKKSTTNNVAKRNQRVQRKMIVSGVMKFLPDAPSAFLAPSPNVLRRKEGTKLKFSSVMREKTWREGSSSTFSMKSLNNSENQETSGVGSWDGTAVSSVEKEEEALNDWLDIQRNVGGCGISCYWPKKSSRHCCHPGLSSTLRKGKRMFRGGQVVNGGSVSTRASQGLVPFLEKSRDTREFSQKSDDDISTVFGELDLRLQIAGLTEKEEEEEDEGSYDYCTSLSSKYRPKVFEEIVGQSMVVRSLRNSISRGLISPAYLFHGPRGVGKSCAARIFADAVNCRAEENEIKPCGLCMGCTCLASVKGRCIWEVDASKKKSINGIKQVLRSLVMGVEPGGWGHMVFVIDECHLLPSKTWVEVIKFLEYQSQHGVVFIFITSDIGSIPRSVLSHCEKYVFNRIEDCDIVARLRKISAEENLDVEDDALDLIAFNSDGSLHDAETLIGQLTLLGKRITTSVVNELVGIVSSDKLLELVKVALSSKTSETVKRSRQLLESGVDPLALMSQMAALIMDHIAHDPNINDTFSSNNCLRRLKCALKLLSEAKKQLMVSCDKSTWFTATLIRLGSVSPSDLFESGSDRGQSSKTTDDYQSSASKNSMSESKGYNRNFVYQEKESVPKDNIISNISQVKHMKTVDRSVICDGLTLNNKFFSFLNSEELDKIWGKCILRCHSVTLRRLLQSHGKLVSLTQDNGTTNAIITFNNESIKSRAEGFLSSITDSIENVLRCNVEVQIVHCHLPLTTTCKGPFKSGKQAHVEMKPRESFVDYRDVETCNHDDCCYQGQSKGAFIIPEGSNLRLVPFDAETSNSSSERTPEMPLKRIDSIIREHGLETTWLEEEKVAVVPESENHFRVKKNHILPQSGSLSPNKRKYMFNSMSLSSEDWHQNIVAVQEHSEIKVTPRNGLVSRIIEKYPIPPSILHENGFSNDHLGYESGSTRRLSCPAFFCCWSKGIKVQKRRGGVLSFKGREVYQRRRERDGSGKCGDFICGLCR